jgi:hypothetical protein
MMEATYSYETSLRIYQPTWHYIDERAIFIVSIVTTSKI